MDIPDMWAKIALEALSRKPIFRFEVKPMPWWAKLTNKLFRWPKKQYNAILTNPEQL